MRNPFRNPLTLSDLLAGHYKLIDDLKALQEQHETTQVHHDAQLEYHHDQIARHNSIKDVLDWEHRRAGNLIEKLRELIAE